jgi:hypothetical protein
MPHRRLMASSSMYRRCDRLICSCAAGVSTRQHSVHLRWGTIHNLAVRCDCTRLGCFPSADPCSGLARSNSGCPVRSAAPKRLAALAHPDYERLESVVMWRSMNSRGGSKGTCMEGRMEAWKMYDLVLMQLASLLDPPLRSACVGVHLVGCSARILTAIRQCRATIPRPRRKGSRKGRKCITSVGPSKHLYGRLTRCRSEG